MNSSDLFIDVRRVAVQTVMHYGDATALHVDVTGLQLIQLPRPFAWVAIFPACTRGGFPITVSVNVERQGDDVKAFVPTYGAGFAFSLKPYLQPLPTPAKSQGPVVSEAVYANWQKARGC